MKRIWTDRSEPDLDDVLDDPIIRKYMSTDGVSREEMCRNIEIVRKAMDSWRKPVENRAAH